MAFLSGYVKNVIELSTNSLVVIVGCVAGVEKDTLTSGLKG